MVVQAINDPGPKQKPGEGGKGYTNQKLSFANIAYHVKQYWNVPAEISGGKDANVIIAIAVAMAESSGNTNPPTAPHGMFGLFQINMNGSMGTERRRKYGLSSNNDLFIAATNTRVAWNIWHDNGGSWQPWEAYTSGAYQKYMAGAWEGYQHPQAPPNVETDPTINTTIPFIDDIKEWIGGGLLRAATFIGGGALLIFAVVTVLKKGVK